jgi:hypothetical protein
MDIDTARSTSPLPDISSWFSVISGWLMDLFPSIIVLAKNLFGILVGISFPLSFFFLIGIIYCVENLKRLRKREEEVFDKKVEPAFEKEPSGDTVMAHRWQNAIQHIASDNPNDWKQAIIEADIILEDLLTKMGYRGDSIGEKLKRVAKGDMKTLDEAWEAHKVRNQIAHEGSNFSLNHHEAKNVIAMYRKVFEEFYYI